MSEIQPLYSGEAQFRRYSDTSTQGQQVVFALPGRDELQAFIGKEGKRFMAVFVEIGDDEQPVAVKPALVKPREHLGDLCYRAVQWCNDKEFRAWLTRRGDFRADLTADSAADVIKGWCGVTSRKELDTNPAAAEKFRAHIVGPWQRHCQARGKT